MSNFPSLKATVHKPVAKSSGDFCTDGEVDLVLFFLKCFFYALSSEIGSLEAEMD